MKRLPLMVLSAFFLPVLVHAQNESLGDLKRQLQEMKVQFEKQQELQRQQIDALQRQIQNLQGSRLASTSAPASNPMPPESASTNRPSEFFARGWRPTDPIGIRSGNSYLNLSLDGLFAAGTSTEREVGDLQLGGHDPIQRGFTVQNVEVVLEGMVDPYFRGQANLIFQLDADGETVVELEEAYLESISLPFNLQLKAGQFFTEFGRHNPMHPHAWTFVDQPLVNARLLGPDGLRNPGARLSWLMPTPFYSEFFLTLQNSHGETAHSFRTDHEGEPFFGRLHDPGRLRALNDLLVSARYAASFDLTDSQTLLLGASAATGPNGSGSGTDSQIFGFDVFWKWKHPRAHGGFPFVSWQTEVMARRYQAGAFDWDLDGDGTLQDGELDLNGDGTPDRLPGETVIDYGFYSQVAYGFKRGWVAALRGEWVDGERADYEEIFGRDPGRQQRWRISPNLTWFPSEFSRIRLQYNYDRREREGTDHSVWLQWQFLIGTHSAHKF